MDKVLGLAGLVVALGAGALLWQRILVQQRSRRRLAEPERGAAEDREDREDRRAPASGPRFVRTHYVLPWLAGLLLAAFLYLVPRWPWTFDVTFGLIAGLLGMQLEQFRVGRVTFLIEQQLSDAIDLMVAALQAGAGTMSAMENALQESRQPLRPQLEEVLGRIRYGDDPPQVLRALERRVPLEVFRLFVSALTVHWETGGSLAPTLATVGRVVRDRIEVNRRIRTLSTQGRVSVLAVLVLTYFLALVMWRNDPDRMRQFLSTTVGQALTAAAMLLQALGIAWSAALSRLKY